VPTGMPICSKNRDANAEELAGHFGQLVSHKTPWGAEVFSETGGTS
jgi:hypothetical protein